MWHISIHEVETNSDKCNQMLPFKLLSYFFEVIHATRSESRVHVILAIPPSQAGSSYFIMCIFYHLIYRFCLLQHFVLLSLQRKNILTTYLCLSCFLFFTSFFSFFFSFLFQTSLNCKPDILISLLKQIAIFIFIFPSQFITYYFKYQFFRKIEGSRGECTCKNDICLLSLMITAFDAKIYSLIEQIFPI